MFTLHDNRAQLYQWDLDRKVIVNDANICEVHFCNRTSDCSLVVEPYKLDNVIVADIPNILLQEARPIRVYAYCDDKYTLTESQFTVKARTRPADYVYTETETLQYSSLDNRLTQLEESLPAKIEEAVSNHLEEHPLEVDLSDYYNKAQTNAAIEEAIEGIEIPETDLTGYATEQFVLDKVAEIDIPEADVDLSDYYTKEETDAAIHNSKDTFYLDFRYATEANQPATEDMIEFATRWLEGQNVCAHVRAPEGGVGDITGYQAVTVQKSVGDKLILKPNGIDPAGVSNNGEGTYYSFIINNNSTDGWTYRRHQVYQFAIATTDYVDNAIAGSATGDVDLSNYYTKEEVNALFNGIATAEGGSY